MGKEEGIRYLVAIEPGDERHACRVVVPDLTGRFSAGDMPADALDIPSSNAST